jgi:hypothetical protein
MTARPSPIVPIAGYATCLQRDQRGRCTVGQFNWVPERLVTGAASTSPDVIESEMSVALHELVHVFGGMSPGSDASSSPFVDDTGAPRVPADIFTVESDPA